jgi:hypothetical protein
VPTIAGICVGDKVRFPCTKQLGRRQEVSTKVFERHKEDEMAIPKYADPDRGPYQSGEQQTDHEKIHIVKNPLDTAELQTALGKALGESANVDHKLKRTVALCDGSQHSNAVAEASNWSNVMAKVIEFYICGPVPKKVKPVPIEQRGKLAEFPKENFAAQSKTKDNTERGEGSASTVLFFGCF